VGPERRDTAQRPPTGAHQRIHWGGQWMHHKARALEGRGVRLCPPAVVACGCHKLTGGRSAQVNDMHIGPVLRNHEQMSRGHVSVIEEKGCAGRIFRGMEGGRRQGRQETPLVCDAKKHQQSNVEHKNCFP